MCTDPLKFSVAINDVVDRVKEAWEKFEEDKKYMKLYAKYTKAPHSLNLKEETILENRNYSFPEEPIKPSCCLILDDIQASTPSFGPQASTSSSTTGTNARG